VTSDEIRELMESFFVVLGDRERAAFLAHVSLAFPFPSHTVSVLRSTIRGRRPGLQRHP
jgi:hypothetical protein